MTLEKNDKIGLSHHRMEKAKTFFQDAEENFNGGRYRTAVNRFYYAILNASRSLLILDGANPRSHAGVVTMLSLHYVKKNILPPELIKQYKKIYTMRTDADYGDFDIISEEDAHETKSSTEEILTRIEEARATIITSLS